MLTEHAKSKFFGLRRIIFSTASPLSMIFRHVCAPLLPFPGLLRQSSKKETIGENRNEIQRVKKKMQKRSAFSSCDLSFSLLFSTAPIPSLLRVERSSPGKETHTTTGRSKLNTTSGGMRPGEKKRTIRWVPAPPQKSPRERFQGSKIKK